MLAPLCDIASAAWPLASLETALTVLLERLAPRQRAGWKRLFGAAADISAESEIKSAPPPEASDGEALERWLVAFGARRNFDLEAVAVSHGDLDSALPSIAPALLRLPASAGGGLLVVERASSWHGLCCLTPSGRRVRVAIEAVRDALAEPLEAPRAAEIDALLASVGISGGSRDSVRPAVLREQLAGQVIAAGWLIRRSPGGDLHALAREAGLHTLSSVALAAGTFTQILLILSWIAIGQPALVGYVEWGRVDAWSLLLLSTIPLHVIAERAEGLLSIRLGALFKRRLLFSILRLEPDEIGSHGAGHFMGLAINADILELVSLSSGQLVLLGAVQLVTAALFLVFGVGSRIAAALLLAYGLGCWWLVRSLWQEAVRSTVAARALTTDLVEHMVGHRTRLVQERAQHWHEAEDRLLAVYWRSRVKLDRLLLLVAGVGRGWLVVALFGIGADILINPGDLMSLSLCLFGVMLAYQAFQTLGQATFNLVDFAVAWQELSPLFAAAHRPDPDISKTVPTESSFELAPPLLQADGLGFAYRAGGREVLRDCSFSIYPGERLLLDCPSGGGKSTLAALISGLRSPTSGHLRLHGVPRGDVGDKDWRRRVLNVPQFHQNHVFSGSFAFNLLMGRHWPPSEGDLEECRAVCEELGLGPLIEHMPAGLDQMVGEGGWSLSHGERSRMFIARALLQRADVIILDESFASLDPESLERALSTVLRRASALLVIAHP